MPKASSLAANRLWAYKMEYVPCGFALAAYPNVKVCANQDWKRITSFIHCKLTVLTLEYFNITTKRNISQQGSLLNLVGKTMRATDMFIFR
jgi:hypothetical protein